MADELTGLLSQPRWISPALNIWMKNLFSFWSTFKFVGKMLLSMVLPGIFLVIQTTDTYFNPSIRGCSLVDPRISSSSPGTLQQCVQLEVFNSPCSQITDTTYHIHKGWFTLGTQLVLIGIIICIVLTPLFQYKILRQSVRLIKFRIHLTGKKHWRLWWLPICAILGLAGFVAAQLIGKSVITDGNQGFSTCCTFSSSSEVTQGSCSKGQTQVFLQLSLTSNEWLVFFASVMLVWACTASAVESVWSLLFWPHDVFYMTDLINSPNVKNLLSDLSTLQKLPLDQFIVFLIDYLNRNGDYTTSWQNVRRRWWSPRAIWIWLRFFRQSRLFAALPASQIEEVLDIAVQRNLISHWSSLEQQTASLIN